MKKDTTQQKEAGAKTLGEETLCHQTHSFISAMLGYKGIKSSSSIQKGRELYESKRQEKWMALVS
jgi:hypothetical protein